MTRTMAGIGGVVNIQPASPVTARRVRMTARRVRMTARRVRMTVGRVRMTVGRRSGRNLLGLDGFEVCSRR
ncbi:hypothetical protein ACH4UM_32075 [Streptomyces sp. NPDC020801]|uniref:hypothetical protein n=1 Tax=unclassified Streptomyces TaxID=2593676 RepID=UPI0037974B84